MTLLTQICVVKSGYCSYGQFKCKDGQCIPKSKFCDGHLDCSDNSDEIECDLKMCRQPDWFQCTSAHGPCLSIDLKCNDVENCPGGEDELNCYGNEAFNADGWHSSHHNCSEYEYTCQTDRSCIPLDFMCDGKTHCHDGSDESLGCVTAEANCKGFFCKNRRCLESKWWICDGFDDCGDGSDEMNCVAECTLDMGKFLCAENKTCISLEKVCDSKADCPDNSDEISHCTAANNCGNKTCPAAAKCQMMPQSGAECICPKGFKHSLKDSVCIDINECLEHYGACSQTCINVPGSYRCTCEEGYVLKEDNRTCEASGEEALLLYTTQLTVMGVNLRSKRVYTVAKNLTKVIGVSYNGEHIYWTNIQNEGESIVKANADGSQQEILLTAGLDAPEDLAVDWLTGNIYFSDNVMHHIAVCSNNGHFCTTLVTAHHPRGVALWPQRSQIFWTDWGQIPMISGASMDGSNPKALVTEDIHWPNGIALDMHNDRIYWVDAKVGTIESARSDGSDRRKVLEETLKHPYGLAIFEDYIYWSDWGTKSIHSCHKFTGKDHKVVVRDRTIYAVHIYHSSKQRKISHACERSRCSHLCLLAEKNSFTCACPEGMQLGPDQLRCVKSYKKQRLFLGLHGNLLEMEHTYFGRHTIKATHKLGLSIHEMAYNSVNNSVFVADNHRKIISEVDLRSNVVQTLIRGNLGNVTTLAFDHLSHNLYWSDSERHVVEVLSLQTHHRAVVSFFSGVEAPIGLALVPDDGIMFVALKSRRHVHIDQKSLSGHSEHAHVFEDELGDDDIKFATDYRSGTLYWTDSDLGHISYSDYHNLRAYTLRGRLKRPYSLAIVDNDIFWSQLRSSTIHWIHKTIMGPLKRFDIEVDQELYATHELPSRIPLAASTPFQVVDHPCQHWNGGCSHICVTLDKSVAACLCPAGLVFADAKNRSCVDALDCEFRCGSGECLTMSRKCNNRRDCPDNSDEEDCAAGGHQKHKVVCSVGKFMCHNAEQCLEPSERCDGRKQCRDGSDEEHCENFDKTKACHSHQKVCDNGNCVDFSVLCDGYDDCGDNSDEDNCNKADGEDISARPVCTKDMFQCNSGTCIAKSWECDGKIDCSDASDEHDKCDVRECPSEMHRCLLGQCIDKRLVCDGHNDCGDSTDELNCDILKGKEPHVACDDETSLLYKCPSDPSKCFDILVKCNGTTECPRGEDEADCDSTCSAYEFQCKTSKECLRKEFRCDKEKDCADGSDEENCSHHSAWNASTGVQTHERPCGPNMWNCRDGDCVDETRVCDGMEDCDTGADEGPLCLTACMSMSGKRPCAHNCKHTPSGSICSCFDGYKLDSDHRSCLDINECEEEHPCAQICENTHGSFRCSCYPDFMLRPDKTTCKSIESEKSLLFSTYDEVRSMTEQPIMLKVAWKANDSRIIGFDLNVRTRNAYFTTENENIVYQINVDTSEVKSALGLPMPGKVSVDWITDNVYVISRGPAYEIQVCSFSAKMCGAILKVKLRETIKTLTVDAYNRRIFYVVMQTVGYGSHRSRILTANLDGSKREILLTKEDSFVSTMACDPYKKVLYYTDMHQKSLHAISYRSNMKSSPVEILPYGNIITYPSGLAWYENQVYIVNLGAKEAVRCYLYGTKKCKALNLNILNAEGILIDGASRQPIKRNPCNMAQCRGMCVQSEFSYECMCGGAVISETQHCDVNNEITSGALVSKSSVEDRGSSHTAAVAWTLTILAICVLCALRYIYYRRKKQGQREILSSLHFQNPLASVTLDNDNNSSLGTTEASPEMNRENGSWRPSVQGLLQGSTRPPSTEISLHSTKPAVMYEQQQQQQLTELPLVSGLLEENANQHNIGHTMGDYNSDATARLVP